jgi:hypothetical protein
MGWANMSPEEPSHVHIPKHSGELMGLGLSEALPPLDMIEDLYVTLHSSLITPVELVYSHQQS